MIQIVPLNEEYSPAVRRFNERLRPSHVTAFPDSPRSLWLPNTGDRRIYEEFFVAMEEGDVRGGYILIRQDVSIHGAPTRVAGLRLPISEAVVDKKYATVPVRLVRDALRRQPLLFGMGMGGNHTPIARLLKALNFKLEAVPFYFKVGRPVRFLTNSHVMEPWLARTVAYSGLAWTTARLVELSRVRRRGLARRARVETVSSFDVWADRLWREAKDEYSWVSVRDSHVLNALYSPDDRRFLRLRIWDGDRIVGWTVLLDLRLKNHKRFGTVRSGHIVDCFADPVDAEMVIHASTRYLEARGVDFIRSHQSHPAWRNALKTAGFSQMRSLFLFGASPACQEVLDNVDPNRIGVHLNRGDGDSALYLPREGVPAGSYEIPEKVRAAAMR